MSKYAITGWADKDCDVVGEVFNKLEGKYTLLIMSILALEGEKSFGDLKRDLSDVSSKTLTDRLNHLTNSGLISNRRVMEGKVKKSYYYIDTGKSDFLNLLKSFRAYAAKT